MMSEINVPTMRFVSVLTVVYNGMFIWNVSVRSILRVMRLCSLSGSVRVPTPVLAAPSFRSVRIVTPEVIVSSFPIVPVQSDFSVRSVLPKMRMCGIVTPTPPVTIMAICAEASILSVARIMCDVPVMPTRPPGSGCADYADSDAGNHPP